MALGLAVHDDNQWLDWRMTEAILVHSACKSPFQKLSNDFMTLSMSEWEELDAPRCGAP